MNIKYTSHFIVTKSNSMNRTLSHLKNNVYFLTTDPCLAGLLSTWKTIDSCSSQFIGVSLVKYNDFCTMLQRIMGRVGVLLYKLQLPITYISSQYTIARSLDFWFVGYTTGLYHSVENDSCLLYWDTYIVRR